MSPSQIYHHHPGIFHSESMPNLDANGVSTQWYTPTSYAFDTSYISPLPSSTLGTQSWAQLARSSAPENSLPQYATPSQILPAQQYQPQFKDSSRPRSSPSTFGPISETINWPLPSGLGIYSSGSIGQPTPVTSTFPPTIFQTYPLDDSYVGGDGSGKDDGGMLAKDGQPKIVASPPEIQQPQPRRPYPSIAPDPGGVAAQKRKRDDDDYQDASLSAKKRKRTSSVASTDLSEDDRLLVSLKEEQALPWKEIAARYSAEKGKEVAVAALQMRYKRLRERHRVWTELDLNALKQAYDKWEKCKWEIISEKMMECGVLERWNAKQCAKKWQELEMAAVSMATTVGLTPAMSQFSTSQFSSPIDAPSHYAWMPLP